MLKKLITQTSPIVIGLLVIFFLTTWFSYARQLAHWLFPTLSEGLVNFLSHLLASIVCGIFVFIWWRHLIKQHKNQTLERTNLAELNTRLNIFSQAIENSPVSIDITDINGKIEYVNRFFTQLTGYSPEEAMGNTIQILNSDKQSDEFYKNMRDVITKAGIWKGEFQNKAKNGKLYWVSASISSFQSFNGEMQNFVTIQEDITEKKLFDKVMVRLMEVSPQSTYKELFRALLQTIRNIFPFKIILIMKYVDKEITSGHVITGLIGEEIIEDLHYEFQSAPYNYIVNQKDIKLFKDGIQQEFPEYKFLVDNGIISFLGIPVFDSFGNPNGQIALMDDKPIADEGFSKNILRAFASKTGSEIENMSYFNSIQDSEQFTKSILNSASEGIMVVDDSGNIKTANPALVKISGYSEGEILGKNIFYFSPHLFKRKHIRFISNLLHPSKHKKLVTTMETKIMKKDGALIDVELSVSELLVRGKKNFIGIIHDISIRKQAEFEIKQMALFADYNPAPVLRFDKKGMVIEANYAAKEILSIESGQKVSLTTIFSELAGFDFKDCIKSEQILRINASIKDHVHQLTIKGTPETEYGQIYCVDITQVIEAEKVIQEYNKKLEEMLDARTRELIIAERQAAFGQLIQGIIHNLRGPLSASMGSEQIVSLYVSVLKNEINSIKGFENSKILEKMMKSMELLRESNAQMSEMINSLMTQTRIANTDDREETDLNKLVNKELDFLNADLFFKANVKKNIELFESEINVSIIPSEISQVIQNLIRNAIDAMYYTIEPEISISTRIDDNQAKLLISDNGSGIPEIIIGRLFDPFFTTKPRAENTIGDEPAGTGLGLYMCSETLKAYNGKITVKSELGKGTEFKVIIPMKKKLTSRRK